jgi:hypothetical protein
MVGKVKETVHTSYWACVETFNMAVDRSLMFLMTLKLNWRYVKM